MIKVSQFTIDTICPWPTNHSITKSLYSSKKSNNNLFHNCHFLFCIGFVSRGPRNFETVSLPTLYNFCVSFMYIENLKKNVNQSLHRKR